MSTTRKQKERQKCGTRYTKTDGERWKRWYEQNDLTIEEICRRDRVTRHTVTRWLKSLGTKLKGNPRSFDRKAIYADLTSGKMSQAAIAKKWGCSQRLVSDIATGKLL
jgi:transposase-like protein